MPSGSAQAMICVDADRPHEYMIHIWGSEEPVALLFDTSEDPGGSLSLKARKFFRLAENGSLYSPQLAEAERDSLHKYSAQLDWNDGGLQGQWTGPDAIARSIEFKSMSKGVALVAVECNSWEDFKQWATQSRQNLDAAVYRGHGTRAFQLQTSLHRAGICRLDRYCAETLLQFHAQAEAALDLRLNMNDGGDYAVVLGLGQHHGLPTPLLDWTESPYIAAFFAFADALESAASRPDATHVRIFALTNTFLNMASPPIVVVPYISPYALALAIPPRHNKRLQAQQGRFLVTNVVDLELYLRGREAQVGKRLLHAIDVPISAASEALEDLAFMGVTAATMFPGLDGIGRNLRHQMAFAHKPIRDAGKPAGEPERIADTNSPIDVPKVEQPHVQQ